MAFDLEAGAVAVLWLVCLYRLPTLLRSTRRRSFTLMLIAVALSATINEARVTALVDQATGVANISVLLKNILGLLATMSAMSFADAIVEDTSPRTRRRRLLANTALITAILAMIALFVVIPRHEGGPDFVDAQATNPAVGAYGVLFQLCLGTTLLWISRGYWRYWRSTDSGVLRVTLLLFNLGLGIGAVYVLNRLVFLISHLAGSQLVQGPVYVVVSTTLFAVALLLVAIGSSAYGCRIAWHHVGHYLALHRLYPLWRALSEAVPDVVLGSAPTRRTDLCTLRGLSLRLYRRNIEIRDAQWVLHDHVPATTVERLTCAVAELGLDPATADALVEAAVLEAGRRARIAGASSIGKATEAPFTSGVDFDDEVLDLARLSRRLRSPLVARIVSTVDISTD